MDYQEIEAKTILNPTGGFLSTFTHSLNAYQGCAFGRGGCPYCYVRAMPIQRFAGKPWGDWVKAKVNSPELLAKELARLRGNPLRIFMSTATDPYQGVESRLKLTRRILEVFAASGDFGRLVVQTRSPLIERDIDILALLGKRLDEARGHVHKIEGVRTVATFHPRQLIQNSANKAYARKDLLLLMEEEARKPGYSRTGQ